MIRVECYAVVVPRTHVEKVFPGGWVAATHSEQGFENCQVMFDKFLFAEGAMSPLQVHRFILRWRELGLLPHKNRKWHDICVVDRFKGPTLPCSWLKWDINRHAVTFIPSIFAISSIWGGDDVDKTAVRQVGIGISSNSRNG